MAAISRPTNKLASLPPAHGRFPAGTVFVKTFELQTNLTTTNSLLRLETRLLVRNINGGVYGVTYKWRPDYSDADLLTTSSNQTIVITTANGIDDQHLVLSQSGGLLDLPYAGGQLCLGRQHAPVELQRDLSIHRRHRQ